MKSDTSHFANDSRREHAADSPQLPAGESRFRAFFDQLPGMIYLARADHARTIELASAGSQALLGLKPDAKPFPLAPLIHPDDRDQALDAIKSAVAGHHPFAIEYRLQHANGHWRTVWDQGCPCHHGAQVAVQGQLLDVTPHARREHARLGAEFRRLQTQKFHALNQLAGGVAHEFNNLVAGILGSAELVAMDLPEKNPGHETLKQIFEASNLARDFVHKLRTFGLRPVPEFKPVRLQSVLEECLQILRTIIPARIELHPHFDPDCPKVNADAAQIHQAVLDLCLYLWQGLADRRGRIQIRLEPGAAPPPAAHRRLPPGPHVRLTVRDNSHGLEKSAREHIFHPFRTRRTGGKKVGLELFLARETVEAHQGEIFVESEPGQGVAFHIYLPVAEEK